MLLACVAYWRMSIIRKMEAVSGTSTQSRTSRSSTMSCIMFQAAGLAPYMSAAPGSRESKNLF